MISKLKEFYDKKYKLLTVIMLCTLIIFSGVLVVNKIRTGEFIDKDVSLKGGLLITIQSSESLDVQAIERQIATELDSSVSVKKLQAIGSDSIGYSFTIEKEVSSDDALEAIGKVTGVQLTEGTYAIEEVSGSFGQSFWKSTMLAIAVAFLLMIIVVFVFFRRTVPSLAVVLCAISDSIGTLAIMNLLGIKLSVGGVAALLMLIGYSVDTDILLSSKLLKRGNTSAFDALWGTVKTGMTMQTTSIMALFALWLVTPADMLKQIASILIIGLLLDIPNTWLQNAGIMRYYDEWKSRGGLRNVKA